MVHKRLKDYLAENRIQQKEVAEGTGISQQRLSQILSGRVRLSAEDLSKICLFINADPSIFFKDKE